MSDQYFSLPAIARAINMVPETLRKKMLRDMADIEPARDGRLAYYDAEQVADIIDRLHADLVTDMDFLTLGRATLLSK